MTIALESGSAAIDHVTLAADCTGNDQRGVPWPTPCDIGAIGAPLPTTTTASSLSGGGQSGPSIIVLAGTAVTDAATLSGTNASTATGTVTYSVYSDAGCTMAVSTGAPEVITTPGTLPDSNPVTLTTPGTYYWQTSYSGDDSNDSATSACGSGVETVTPEATTKTALKLSATKVTYGHEQTDFLSVTVSPQYPGTTPSGRVTITESSTTLCVITLSSGKGSCTLSAKRLNAGTYQLVATYEGSTDFDSSTSAKETLTVAKATTRTALKLSTTKMTYGDEQVDGLSVTVSPQFAGSTPTGSVTIKESTTRLCVIKLKSDEGSCRLSAKKLKAGTYRLVATCSGSTNFGGSTSAKETLAVGKATTKTALKLSATKVTYGHEQTDLLSVTVSPQYPGTTPTGTVTIKESTTRLCVITLSSVKGSCVLSADKLAPGSYHLVATYGGSVDFDGSSISKVVITVEK